MRRLVEQLDPDPDLFPRLSRRLQTAAFDGVFLGFVWLISLSVLSAYGITGKKALVTATGLSLSLEPLLVSITGGSIGHHLLGLRVRRLAEDKKINLFAAALRYIIKTVFGAFSALTITTSRQRRAVHDFISGSVVVSKYANAPDSLQGLAIQKADANLYACPPKWRRLLLMAVYTVFFTFAMGLVQSALISEACLLSNRCGSSERAAVRAFSVLWIIALFIIVSQCWSGNWFGCRKTLTARGSQNKSEKA